MTVSRLVGPRDDAATGAMRRGTTSGVASFVPVCAACGLRWPGRFLPVCAACGGLIEIHYDLAAVRIRDADQGTFGRYRDLLPVSDLQLLGGGLPVTPTVHARRLGRELGLDRLYLKDETCLPTGTTKDRMAAVALAYLHEAGVNRVCVSSTGNSSTAFAYALERFPDMELSVFTAATFERRVSSFGRPNVTHFVLEGATFDEAGREAAAYAGRHGLVFERGFFNPGRREGLKTAWLEAVEQVPHPIDWYVQAVSSAMGVHGVFKGARELLALGRIDRLPRLLCVQQGSCAPMASAWAESSETIRPHHVVRRPDGIAEAILRGDPSRVYPYVRSVVLDSRGTFAVVTEEEIRAARAMVEQLEGIRPCNAASAAVAGVAQLARSGRLAADETVLVNLTGRERAEPSPVARTIRLHRASDGEGWRYDQEAAA